MAHLGRPSPVKNNEIVRASQKIADIQEADANLHTVTMDSLGLPMNTIYLQLAVLRVSGTGLMRFYPYSAAASIRMTNSTAADQLDPHWIGIEHGILTYRQTVAADDWDVYLLGYVVQRRKEYRK